VNVYYLKKTNKIRLVVVQPCHTMLTLAFGRAKVEDVGDVVAFKAKEESSSFADYYSWAKDPTLDE